MWVRVVLVVAALAFLYGCNQASSPAEKQEKQGSVEEGKTQQEAKARSLPGQRKALRPGEYRTKEFKPSLSFKVGKGWTFAPPQMPDFLQIEQEGKRSLRFTSPQEVYKPGTYDVVEAPKDLVGWYQHHPYLKTDQPEPVTVGGVKGKQFDVVVAEDLPKDYSGMCGTQCVDTYMLSDGLLADVVEAEKRRVIVLEDVKGATATIEFASSPTDFDDFLPEAQKVVDSVKWSGS